MTEDKDCKGGTRRERLMQRMSRMWPKRTDDTSVRRDEIRRRALARVETPLAWDPIIPGTKIWKQVGGFASAGREQIQLAASRAEPGGVPVFVDPAMVTPATAERMRPLFRR